MDINYEAIDDIIRREGYNEILKIIDYMIQSYQKDHERSPDLVKIYRGQGADEYYKKLRAKLSPENIKTVINIKED